MADLVIARGQAECPRLDTISWYDGSYDHLEPDFNERPYFTKVEEKRRRTGLTSISGATHRQSAHKSFHVWNFEMTGLRRPRPPAGVTTNFSSCTQPT